MITLLHMNYNDYRAWEADIHIAYNEIQKIRRTEPKEYQERMEKLNLVFSEFGCPNPSCKANGQMRIFGFYNRYVVSFCSISFDVVTVKGEILRLRCKSCNSTHAVLPEDIIPYFAPTIDTCALSVYNAFYNPGVSECKRPKMLPINRARQKRSEESAEHVVVAKEANDSPNQTTKAQGSSPWDFDIRANFSFKGLRLFANGHCVPKFTMNREASVTESPFSISTLYAFREKFEKGWSYVTATFRFMGLWNKAGDPSIGEGIRILFVNSLTAIQKGMFLVHSIPFLFPISCRTVSEFPYTGCA